MKALVVANWKMNPTSQKDAERLFDLIKKGVRESENVEIVICPPFVYLEELIDDSGFIKFGGQNCFWEQSGAFTGEISPVMFKDLGCEYVILGHSERRTHLSETNEMINKKVRAVLEAGLKPIFCIGETQEQKKQNQAQEILNQQINHLATQSLNHLIIAYEPVWAIGTDNPCGSEQAKKILLFLKEILPENTLVLYGGSVNSNNAKDYIEVGFNGLLVGSVSLDAEEFIKIIQALDKI